MGRIAWVAVALVLLTAAPAAQAGWLLHALTNSVDDAGKVAAKDAAKAGAKGAEATANGVKIENNALEATGASVEANGMKVEPGGSGGGGGDDTPVPGWFYVLCVVGVGGWLLLKFRGKRA
jgi:hypothetical protein